jgi:glycosyltransferase involved in cell wall biosynthesis/GT2 family glycosyltransferase/SAM-dependent methyltransferase
MGEIFKRTTPVTALAWTGERLTTDVSGQVEIEHLHRYFFARTLCRGLDVLDIASGEGYGSALLAQVAHSVVGIDVSAEAVLHAQKAYQGPGLQFMQGDARRIGLEDASVDVVVSFETIEHFYEHDAFLAEVQRVLRPGGLFIVSSPERDVYSPADRSPNPYHVRELTHSEFSLLLARSFRHVTMYAQRPLLGTALVAENPPADAGPLITFERRGDQHFECSAGLPRALYLLAVASDRPRTDSLGSLYVDSGNIEAMFDQIRTAHIQAEDWRQQLIRSQALLETATQKAEDWRQKLIRSQALLETATQKEAALQDLLDQKDQEVRQLAAMALESERPLRQAREQAETLADYVRKEGLHQAALSRKDQELHQLTLRASDSERRLEQVLRSTSWRITFPLRGFVTRHPKVATRLRGFATRHPALRKLARRIWRRLNYGFTPPPPAPTLVPAAQPAILPVEAAFMPPVGSAASQAGPGGPPKFWFFLGDTIDWSQAHAQLTGVGRVTAELFFASLGDTTSNRMMPCMLEQNDTGLRSIGLRDAVELLASRVGTRTSVELLGPVGAGSAPPVAADAPDAGDHVLFTGAVWTPQYQALFRTLSQRSVRFSVLVYDIVPIENPEFVSEPHARMFADWLGTTLALASIVFVTSHRNKDQILRWAALAAAPVAVEIKVIDFGVTEHGQAMSAAGLAANDATAQVRTNAFVLCVGTIERRKNQVLLCRVWQRLVADLGRGNVPQLVLVGRNDLDLGNEVKGIKPLLEASDIVVLEGVGDAELAGLYNLCMMTAYPSLSEGYGLPVAESLGAGKLCLSSDLPVIREHAGSLPWYFDPGDEDAAYAAIRRAIDDPDARASAESRIADEYRPTSWKSTYSSMAGTVALLPWLPHPRRLSGQKRPVISGVAPVVIPAALAAAQEYCTDLDPEVSILVINWNAAELTRECVRHIWANTTGIRYEVIIVDNGSDPADFEALGALGSGVRVLALGTNRYFGEANNIAAEQAKGRFICLLNNDAFGQPGWLRQLVDCLEHDPSAGAAGPLFLFPDGTIQEAGAAIDADGFPIRFGRGHNARIEEFLIARAVDYISAATLLIPRDLFLAAGGFDLAYEPAYYEDVDLCFKIRGLGRTIRFCPEARVVHLEGASANDNPIAEARRRMLGDLNRGKFVSRWGAYLTSRTDSALEVVTRLVFSQPRPPKANEIVARRKSAALFTPYPLTPGGGERFLLTIALALLQDHDVTIVTKHPYSVLRLLSIGHSFGFDLSGCQLTTAAEFEDAPDPDVLVSMGNQIVPPMRARSNNSVFICQFPFPLADAEIRDAQARMGNYRAIIVYSDYVRAHVLAGLSANRMPSWPVKVTYPPAPQLSGSADRKKTMILSVGRFYAGGHNKRHDLMISAFQRLLTRLDSDVELHLAGSSIPDPIHMDYLNSLKQMANGLPVTFHVNTPQETLCDLYRDAAVYWHATGVESDLVQHPELAEHFGISVVEAMSAECIPVAFCAGGPREIITHGVDGFLYSSVGELVEITADLLRADSGPVRLSVGRAARRRAMAFRPEAFVDKIREILDLRHALEDVDHA